MIWLQLHEILNWLLRLGMVPVVLQRRRTTAAATSWLLVIFLYPIVGVFLYLLFGSTRLGKRRILLQRAMLDVRRTLESLRKFEPQPLTAACPLEYVPLARQAQKISGFPVVGGNDLTLHVRSDETIAALVADIDSAEREVHLLFYIFWPDAVGVQVADALLKAAKRGVKCRVLVDALGSRPLFRGGGLAQTLKAGGVELAAAMRLWRVSLFLPRVDLRNHRKLAVIDGRVAWLGSQNIVSPDYGGRTGGPWFDMMMRIGGPIVAELQAVFIEDWLCETGQELACEIQPPPAETAGNIAAQIVATGPTEIEETFRRVVIAAAGVAQREMILTTPYFAPDESTELALLMAADRGVKVTLIMPARGDHLFTAAAGRASIGPLLDGGCTIYLFNPGLLHSKSITVDGTLSLVGSANLDVRSFNLNFEMGVLIYNADATKLVRDAQMKYVEQSTALLRVEYAKRAWIKRLGDDVCGLLSPLL